MVRVGSMGEVVGVYFLWLFVIPRISIVFVDVARCGYSRQSLNGNAIAYRKFAKIGVY